MPTPLDPNAIIQVTIDGMLYDQQCLSVFHYFFAPGNPDFRSLFDDLANNIDSLGGLLNTYCGTVTSDWTLTSLDIQQVWPQRLAKVGYLSTLVNKHGVLVAPAVPSNTAAVLTKRCDFAGRGFIGTIHVPGLPQSETNGDLWTVGIMGNLATLGVQIAENQVAGFEGPFESVLWNIATPANHAKIVSCIPQESIRVMRRRTKGVGR